LTVFSWDTSLFQSLISSVGGQVDLIQLDINRINMWLLRFVLMKNTFPGFPICTSALIRLATISPQVYLKHFQVVH